MIISGIYRLKYGPCFKTLVIHTGYSCVEGFNSCSYCPNLFPRLISSSSGSSSPESEAVTVALKCVSLKHVEIPYTHI